MKKATLRRVTELGSALNFFTAQLQEGMPPLVTGNVGYLPLSWRIATAQELLKPLLDGFSKVRAPLVEQAKVPEKAGDIPLPAGHFRLDATKLDELLRPIMDEEVDVPELKPLTWAMLAKAGVSVDPTLVIMLGDFLTGEPPEED